MKKIMNGILLLGILFLTACGGEPVPEPLPEDGLRGPGEAPSDHPGWTVDMEREVYDPSLTTFAEAPTSTVISCTSSSFISCEYTFAAPFIVAPFLGDSVTVSPLDSPPTVRL